MDALDLAALDSPMAVALDSPMAVAVLYWSPQPCYPPSSNLREWSGASRVGGGAGVHHCSYFSLEISIIIHRAGPKKVQQGISRGIFIRKFCCDL